MDTNGFVNGQECCISISIVKKVCALRRNSHFSSVTAFHPWCYGFTGVENIQIPDEGSNVARFSSLSIVPLLTAPKAFKGMMGKGLPSVGWTETFMVSVCNSMKLGDTLKFTFHVGSVNARRLACSLGMSFFWDLRDLPRVILCSLHLDTCSIGKKTDQDARKKKHV